MTALHARARRRCETGAPSPRVSLADGIARTRTCRPRSCRGAHRAECFLPAMPPRAWSLWGDPGRPRRRGPISRCDLGSETRTDRSSVFEDERRKEVGSSGVEAMRIIGIASGIMPRRQRSSSVIHDHTPDDIFRAALVAMLCEAGFTSRSVPKAGCCRTRSWRFGPTAPKHRARDLGASVDQTDARNMAGIRTSRAAKAS